MQPGPHQPCNSLLLSGLSISAKPQTTKALNISLKLTQNLSWLYVMPVCAWAVKVVHPISRLCNLKLQLIEPAALSAFSLKSHSLWAKPQWYFQTVECGLPVLGRPGQHREGALSRRQSSSVPQQQVACLNYTPNSQNVIDEFRKHMNSKSMNS